MKPIRVTKGELLAGVLTEGTKRQILEHNVAWKQVCGSQKTSAP